MPKKCKAHAVTLWQNYVKMGTVVQADRTPAVYFHYHVVADNRKIGFSREYAKPTFASLQRLLKLLQGGHNTTKTVRNYVYIGTHNINIETSWEVYR
jgi:hypothetical protein